jgi:hypothetical protein
LGSEHVAVNLDEMWLKLNVVRQDRKVLFSAVDRLKPPLLLPTLQNLGKLLHYRMIRQRHLDERSELAHRIEGDDLGGKNRLHADPSEEVTWDSDIGVAQRCDCLALRNAFAFAVDVNKQALELHFRTKDEPHHVFVKQAGRVPVALPVRVRKPEENLGVSVACVLCPCDLEANPFDERAHRQVE